MAWEAWKLFAVERLKVQVFQDRAALGQAAAAQAVRRIAQMQKEKGELRMIFASAPSQNEFWRR
ncbi:hypothetical protein [Paenibacillus sp. UNC451MF]|uniref:hypothetical protein n=1 Tax=Paenibacillus sp. UNC451MF TaxID=1449063 RepID=UPI00048A4A6B|nr:hypothetical protein [Paenibacillus sp. UNC451MF]